ncbi:hypothetical protein H0H92_004868 [Tricholoma furcatifolium]|nr:hypothetical protein H0H92_004868 [Tricholoma furcatifolium]
MPELIAHQPIDPSFLAKLDPEYIQFHNSTLQYIVPPHTLAWEPSIRHAPAVPGGAPALEVAKTQDFSLTHTKIRTFTPHGQVPKGGWPVFIFFHGGNFINRSEALADRNAGGWTLGNIESETSFSTHMAVGANCVVVSVDYRLAPEHPYPAAVEDAVETLDWILSNGASSLSINTSQIAVGGSSRDSYVTIIQAQMTLKSGGNLAAILALKAAERSPSVPLVFQLLIVPVTDNTASVDNLWAGNRLTPWLNPERMMWFRNNYLPNSEDWAKWDASPIFAPKELLAKVPKAWIGVAELDILKDEGVLYGNKMKQLGVDVETVVYERAPHPIMAMDGKIFTLFLGT